MTTLLQTPQPLDDRGDLDLAFRTIDSSNDLDGTINPYTRSNSFRTGQQLLLVLGIELRTAAGDGNFITRLKLKPWWARAAQESRQAYGGNGLPIAPPGTDQGVALDASVFGVGPNPVNRLDNNRYVWLPSPKYIDVTQFQTPPPPAADVGNSESLWVDDVWVFDLPDPATVAANFGPDQSPALFRQFFYPAYGWALGFTAEATLDDPDGDPLGASINLTWQQAPTMSSRRSANVSLP